MATPTPAQVRTISLSTVFDAVADGVIEVAVGLAALRYAASTAEPSHTEVVALVACHLLWWSGTLVPGQLPPQGVVTSASSGGVSASFGVVVPGQVGTDDLTTTTWGRSALELLRTWDPSFRAGP